MKFLKVVINFFWAKHSLFMAGQFFLVGIHFSFEEVFPT